MPSNFVMQIDISWKNNTFLFESKEAVLLTNQGPIFWTATYSKKAPSFQSWEYHLTI